MTAANRYENGLAAALERFFDENPTEELTFDDILTKFGRGKWQASVVLKELIAEGKLEHVKVVRRPGRRA